MNDTSKPFFTQALDALKRGDRRRGAALLKEGLQRGSGPAEALPAVLQLSMHIGEIELAIEASRRMIAADSVASMVAYWGTLSSCGRSEEALADIACQPVRIREHPDGSIPAQGKPRLSGAALTKLKSCFGEHSSRHPI